MHLTAQGCKARGCEMHQTPSALGFPTQLPGSILVPMTEQLRTQQLQVEVTVGTRPYHAHGD